MCGPAISTVNQVYNVARRGVQMVPDGVCLAGLDTVQMVPDGVCLGLDTAEGGALLQAFLADVTFLHCRRWWFVSSLPCR